VFPAQQLARPKPLLLTLLPLLAVLAPAFAHTYPKTLCFALANIIDGGSGQGREWCSEAVKAFVRQAREITAGRGMWSM
jgi:hypothetical protein